MNNQRSTPAVKSKQPKQKKTAQMSKSAKRRQRESNRVAAQPFNSYIQPGPTISGSLMRPKRSVAFMRNPKLSKEGSEFLKSAFAPPDFTADGATGIPDGFTGRVLVKKHKLVQPLTFNSGKDYFIVVAPVPGIAYYILETGAGSGFTVTDELLENPYSDTAQLFGPKSGAQSSNKLTGFRIASLCAELVPTTNAMTWSGNIQCFRAPIFQNTSTAGIIAGTAGNAYAVAGLESLNSTIVNMYAAPFNLGVFAAAGNMDKEFEFRPIVEGYDTCPVHLDTTQHFGKLGRSNGPSPYTGMGQTESIVIRISGLSTTCTALIKTWSCVEYKVNSVEPLYEYTLPSPQEDKLAMDCYRQILLSLPPGVSYFENAGLWERILNVVRTVSGAMSYIPGPYGGIAKGVNMASSALADLTIK